MIRRRGEGLVRAIGAAVGICAATGLARAEDVSAPVILQYFESRYGTIENRMPDVFKAGYGAIYTPPPGRADQGSFSVGYDQYDRFDLGKPGNPTLYGTETGLKKTVDVSHKAGMDYYLDYVLNHDGYSNSSSVDGDGHSFYDAGGYPGINVTLPYDADGDFNSAYNYGDINGRLAGLLDINHGKNYQMIRNPVPGFANNIRAGTQAAFGRIANVPDENNRRFYPDRNLQPIMVYDPKTGEQNIPIYPFNNANPLAGDPVEENVTGYLMRNAQWLVQSIGVDGFRLDAAKHVEGFSLDYFDRSVYRASVRPLLDGSQRNIFSFQEVYDGDQNFLQTFVRKDIQANNPGRIGGNRDALDFPLFFAMRDNLTGNGFNNSWYNIRNASFDLHDDGAHNGSQGVMFVSSHDNEGAYLSNVAYAYMLMQPGNAVVYYNAKEFGNNRDFPKDGRGDALGGVYGNAIPGLVDIRNRYGRGNYVERWIEKENFAFERSGSALVLLSNRVDAGYDSRTILTNFAPGTRLIELTGNASNPSTDPFNDIPEMLVVNNDHTVNVRFLRNVAPGTNNFTGNGYLIYGLASPVGTLSVVNAGATLAGGTPTPATNGTTRLADIKVVNGNTFQVKLDTSAVKLLGTFREHDADGDNALLRIDEGLDLNNNGHVDFVNPGNTAYGFEEFSTVHSPGYFSANGNGTYTQTIDATKLSEGMHFVTARAYRHRDDGGPAIFTDFKQSIYVDRLKPVSAVDSFVPWQAGVDQNRDLYVRSTDQTADNVHILFDLPAGLTEAQILAMIGSNTQADKMDRDLFKRGQGNLVKGNHVATVVTYEITGNYNVQRFAGLFTQSPLGRGLGDLNHDGQFSPADVANQAGAFEQFLYSRNQQFDAAGDLNGDGKIDDKDLFLLKATFVEGGASQAAVNEVKAAIVRRGDLNHDGLTNAGDINYLTHHLSDNTWDNDLNADGAVNSADVETLVKTVLNTTYGDLNLDGRVNFADFQQLELNFGRSGRDGWQFGDLNGDGVVNRDDFLLLRQNFGYVAAADPVAGAWLGDLTAVPEPTGLAILGLAATLLNRRRRVSGISLF